MESSSSIDIYSASIPPDAAILKGFLAERTEELLHLRDEEAYHLAKLQDVRLRMDSAELFIRSHSSFISRIPDEMLAEIFQFCLPVDHHPVRSMTEAPLLLTIVNRTWRRVALSTPRLWCSIHLALSTNLDSWESGCRGLQWWIAKAGSLPLSISIASNADFASSSPQMQTFLQLVASLAGRIRQLDLQLRRSVMKAFEDVADLAKFEQLEGISLLYHDVRARPLAYDIPLPLRSLISRKTLRRVSFNQPVWQLPTPPAWEKLSELSLRSSGPRNNLQLDVDTVLKLLCQTKSLQSCVLTVNRQPLLATQATSLIDLPLLQSLFIEDITPLGYETLHAKPWTTLLPRLHTPALKDLALKYAFLAKLRSAPEHAPISSFILQSGCQIESLQLDLQLSQAELEQCFSLTPGLKSLSMVDPFIEIPSSSSESSEIAEPPTLEQPTLEQPGVVLLALRTLCPRLERLQLMHCFHLPSDVIFEIAEHRASNSIENAHGSFRALHVRYDSEFPRDKVIVEITKSRLKELREGGIHVQFEYRIGVQSKVSPWDGNDHCFDPFEERRPFLTGRSLRGYQSCTPRNGYVSLFAESSG